MTRYDGTMTNPWPAVIVVSVLLASVTVLGVTHVLDAAWIERTLSAMVGLVVGHTLGSRTARPPSDSTPKAT